MRWVQFRVRNLPWLAMVAGSLIACSKSGDGNPGSAGGQGNAAVGGSTRPDGAVSSGAGGSSASTGVDTTNLGVRFADFVVSRWPDPRNIAGKPRQWDYNNGIVLRGMLEVYKKTHDVRYREYIKQYVDYFVDPSGTLYSDSAQKTPLQTTEYSLDLIQPAILLLFLSEQYPDDTRYATAATTVRNMFTNFPTNEEGGFWHKKIYPNEMWLDSIYMAETFLIKYGTMNALCGAYCQDTPVAQATLLASHVRLDSGLLLQGWDYDHNAAWCLEGCAGATGTGLSPEVWSRGLGWYSAALVDILEYLPETHAGRSKLLTLLQGIASGLKQNQDVTSGMWCQVVDKCALSDNWPESSGTGLLVYALKTGVDRGYLDTSYLDVANKAWSGLKANKIGSDAYGPIINDSADGMSIQSSYANYVAIAKKANSYHGLCAIMLAAAAMEY